jgi:methylase of polypeptide subunit release factors
VRPGPLDAPTAERLRCDLAAAGYTVDGVAVLLGEVAAAALHRDQLTPARLALRDRAEPAAVLARLYMLAEPVPRAALDAAVPTLGTAGLAALGLVDSAGAAFTDEARGRVDLRPYAAVDALGEAAWWIASDRTGAASGGPLPTDYVLGIGGASTMLAQLTLRRPVGRVLDLGTGCGVQALHAGRHAGQVVATDLSPRALAFAAFNTALAGVPVDLRAGSLFEPVAGERFDLVVSNPPFVITPRRSGVPAYEYRDAGLVGDALMRGLVTGVGAVLTAGGVAQLLGNWEHHAGQDWRERVGGWLDESGLDGWVVQREQLDPAEYAQLWVRDAGEHAGHRNDQLVEAWLTDFAGRGVQAVGLGLLTLRRPVGGRPTLRRLEEQPGPARQPLGAHLARCLAAHDLLTGLDDDALLAGRWVVAPDVTEERHHVPGEAEPRAVLLRQTDGFGRVVPVGTVLAAAVGACDGELPLGVIAAAIAELLGVATDPVRAEVLEGVRRLAADGLLEPVPDAGW